MVEASINTLSSILQLYKTYHSDSLFVVAIEVNNVKVDASRCVSRLWPEDHYPGIFQVMILARPRLMHRVMIFRQLRASTSSFMVEQSSTLSTSITHLTLYTKYQ